MPKGVYVRKESPLRHLGKNYTTGRKPVDPVIRFWAKVDKTKTCWLWTATSDSHGYGKLQVGTFKKPRLTSAHRFSYELEYGPLPKGKHVLHHCDVKLCVRPDHLFSGTSQDNMSDKVAKGRQTRGENHPFAKLTSQQVREIRSLGDIAAPGKLAKRYGVSYFTIRNVLTGKTYQDVS